MIRQGYQCQEEVYKKNRYFDKCVICLNNQHLYLSFNFAVGTCDELSWYPGYLKWTSFVEVPLLTILTHTDDPDILDRIIYRVVSKLF